MSVALSVSPRRLIPVHEPDLGHREAEFARDAVLSGMVSGSAGEFIGRFEREFAAYCGCRYGVAVSSGTAALHLAMRLHDIGPGDEVLVSALTNIATANAVVQCGGTVVPVDSDPDTWCMDVGLVQGVLDQCDNPRAIIPVHVYGHPVDMDALLGVAALNELFVAEDAAEAHGAEVQGQRVGSWGDVGCFSFYANKVVTTGEGGMLVTDREDLADRARSLRNLAFGRPRFVHHDTGYNYRLTNVQAAIGCAQMERIDEVVSAKRALAAAYIERLRDVPGLRLPVERAWARNVYWMFALVVEEEFGASRDDLTRALDDAGIESRTMFCPMGLQPSLRGHLRDVQCPVAERLWQRGLYLPSDHRLTDGDLDRICDVIRETRR